MIMRDDDNDDANDNGNSRLAVAQENYEDQQWRKAQERHLVLPDNNGNNGDYNHGVSGSGGGGGVGGARSDLHSDVGSERSGRADYQHQPKQQQETSGAVSVVGPSNNENEALRGGTDTGTGGRQRQRGSSTGGGRGGGSKGGKAATKKGPYDRRGKDGVRVFTLAG